MDKKIFKTVAVLVSTFVLSSILYFSINRKNNSKNFIIENADKITRYDSCSCEIDSLSGYYTDVSIKLKSDSSYTVIFWGDRNSWLWDFKLDYYYDVDIPYQRYKGKDVSKDLKIIEILKNIK